VINPWSLSQADNSLAVGRLKVPSESLLHYDTANGFDFAYYNNTRSLSYSPRFVHEPDAQEREKAKQLCTVDGDFNDACAYDYYATGNDAASQVTATTSHLYTTAQNTLGLFDTFNVMSVN